MDGAIPVPNSSEAAVSGSRGVSRRSVIATALAVSIGAGISLVVGATPAAADEFVPFADRPECIA